MKITIYQVNLDRDEKNADFLSLESIPYVPKDKSRER